MKEASMNRVAQDWTEFDAAYLALPRPVPYGTIKALAERLDIPHRRAISHASVLRSRMERDALRQQSAEQAKATLDTPATLPAQYTALVGLIDLLPPNRQWRSPAHRDQWLQIFIVVLDWTVQLTDTIDLTK